MPEWVIPWLLAGLAVWPLRRVERWIHKHIQGLGLLVTNDPRSAVLFYYIMLVPGVILREVTQWLVAQVLRVKVKKFRLWPEQKGKSGPLRLGLVEIDHKNTDNVRATLIGITPLAVGVVVLGLIGSRVMDTSAFLVSLQNGDVPTILRGFGALMNTPDFWVWVYVIFTVANAMLPEEHDQISWLVLVVPFVVLTVSLFLLQLGVVARAILDGPLADLARLLSLALIMALVIDLFFMAVIAILEAVLGRLLGREVEYK